MMMRFTAVPAAVAGALLILATACGGGDASAGPSGPSGPSNVVSTVSVTGGAAVDVGKTTLLAAQARDASGSAISGKTFTWSSSSNAVASVGSDGTVTGNTAGTATISASVDGKTGSLVVTVNTPLPAVGSVAVSGTAALQAGSTTQLSAVVKDASGAVMTSVPVTWSSSDSTVMTVASNGTVNAVHIGTVTITATASGKSGTLDVTSSLTPYTFNFTNTSPSDARLIMNAVQFAHAWYLTTFGRTITKPTTVGGSTTSPGCAQGGSAAFTGAGSVIFCVANPGWIQNPTISRQKITIHELFHVWQFESKWLGGPGAPAASGATWAIEGSAELVGYYGVDALGLLPISTVRGCVVKEVTDFSKQQPPGLPPLQNVEAQQAFQTTVGPLYSLSLTAMDQLTGGSLSGLVSLKTYGDAIGAGTPWQTAFNTAFGTSTSAFYAQFPSYYSTLPIPANYLCRV